MYLCKRKCVRMLVCAKVYLCAVFKYVNWSKAVRQQLWNHGENHLDIQGDSHAHFLRRTQHLGHLASDGQYEKLHLLVAMWTAGTATARRHLYADDQEDARMAVVWGHVINIWTFYHVEFVHTCLRVRMCVCACSVFLKFFR